MNVYVVYEFDELYYENNIIGVFSSKRKAQECKDSNNNRWIRGYKANKVDGEIDNVYYWWTYNEINGLKLERKTGNKRANTLSKIFEEPYGLVDTALICTEKKSKRLALKTAKNMFKNKKGE